MRPPIPASDPPAPQPILASLDPGLVAPLLAERHRALAAELPAWVAGEIAPLVAHDDASARAVAGEILRRLGAGGLLRHAVPTAYGGSPQAPDLAALCLAREAVAAASPLADSILALQGLGSLPITFGGRDEVKERWLPGIAAGTVMAAFAMTEEGAGSDVGALATRAVREGDGYRLDGEKWLISNAGLAHVYVVFAQLDPARGTRGLAAFAVPADLPGVELVRPQVLAAPHPLGVMRFSACRIPAAWRLAAPGAGENRDEGGFKLGMRTLDRLRPTVAAAACGMAARALAEAIAHARSRRQFGQPLADFQLVQARLATMASELAAARLLTYRAAWAADAGQERITLEAATAKAYATEAAQRIVDGAVQIVGGRAVVDDHPLDHLYRAVRALRIYEGATEIQHLVIARHLLAD
jgi:acyl-CoA dehydrogenase